MQPKKLTQEQVQAILSEEVQEALDFVEGEVHDDRIKARRYMKGEVDLHVEEDGEGNPVRSSVIASKVRDAVRTVKPALMRIFMQDDPVQFVPKRPEDVAAAEQATEYVLQKFDDADGYRVLYDVFDDALVEKTGIAKVYWEDNEEVEFDEYSNLTPEEWQLVEADPEVEVLSVEQMVQETEFGPLVTFEGKVKRTKTTGRMKVVSVAPEDFFVDGNSTCIEDARVIGDSSEVTVGDVVRMGYDFEEVYPLSGEINTSLDDDATFARQGWTEEQDGNAADPTTRPILLTEVYMRLDIEGTGVPTLYQFTCAGDKYTVLDYQEADDIPYAVFMVDPIPHAFFGTALADILIPDQDAATSLLRGLLDNVHMTNNPRCVVTEQNGYIEDAQNGEIGAILRQRAPGGYEWEVTPSMVASVLPALQYYDQTIEAKTGITRAAAGLDTNALTNTSATAANIVDEAQTAAAELMARNLAETGMRPLARKMLKIIRAHAQPQEMMRSGGAFVPVDPRSWNTGMDVKVNVGLGTNRHEQKIAALQGTLQYQQLVLQSLGPGNPIVTLAHTRNTQADLNKLLGVHDSNRYFNPITVEQEQQMMQAQQQQQQQQGDPNAAFMQAEMMKVQQRDAESQRKLQLDAIKFQAEEQRKRAELATRSDIDRDKMLQDLILKVAELEGKLGVQIDEQAIQAEQAQNNQQ